MGNYNQTRVRLKKQRQKAKAALDSNAEAARNEELKRRTAHRNTEPPYKTTSKNYVEKSTRVQA